MKFFKLWVHQQTFSEDPLIVNPREFPSERVGDILEIYHPEDDNTRLLLQINSIRSDFQQKDTISIEQSVANIFQLRTYCDVQVNKVRDFSRHCIKMGTGGGGGGLGDRHYNSVTSKYTFVKIKSLLHPYVYTSKGVS